MHETNDAQLSNEASHRLPFQTTRRTLLKGALGAAGVGAFAIGGTSLRAAPAHAAATPEAPATAQANATPATPAAPTSAGVVIFPLPGTRTASVSTTLTFRGVTTDALGAVKVVGKSSGEHSGIIVPHADGHGASYLPDVPFAPGEEVNVAWGLHGQGGQSGASSFVVATSLEQPVGTGGPPVEEPANVHTYVSRPDLKPPKIVFSAPAGVSGGTAPGYVFLAPKNSPGQLGVMILENGGAPIWFLPPAGDIGQMTDFRVQQYRGQPILTYWEGVSAIGHGLGHYVMRDASYQEITRFRVGNGFHGGDLHAFYITPENTALIPVYNLVRWDLSSVGGPADGQVMDTMIQELEIATGRVLFEWHALDHIGLDETYMPPPKDANSIFDPYHLNSNTLDNDGNIITSVRHTSAIYKIDRRTGELIWRLGGKKSSFAMGPGTQPAFQHDANILPNGVLTIFDNGSNGITAPHTEARGLKIKLDTQNMTATLLQAYTYPGGKLLSNSQGDMQVLPNGNVFIGWGPQRPAFSEFAEDGKVLLDGSFPGSGDSYRTYRFSWSGHPTEPPAAAATPGPNGTITVYASWNGATDVAGWQVVGGASPDQLQTVGAAPRSGFETAISVKTAAPYFAVHAMDAAGKVLAASPAVQVQAGPS